MTPTSRTRWTRKEFALGLATVTLVCAAVFLSVSLARPFPHAELGAEWQCKASFLLTSCTRIPHTETVARAPFKKAVCLRRA
jgi:hypothetical protein